MGIEGLGAEPRKFSILYVNPTYAPPKAGERRVFSAMKHIPVDEFASKDAILFLWMPGDEMDAVSEVMKYWGFEYQTSLIWAKESGTVGDYNTVVHDVLYVATRGEYSADAVRVVPSIIRAPMDRDGGRPEMFRHMIDLLYPSGLRIEFGGTRERNGWCRYVPAPE